MNKKELFAQIFYYTGLSWLIFYFSRLWYGNPHIRVVNYHATPDKYKHTFEQQLKFYNKFYVNCSLKDFEQFLQTKKWNKAKPGLIISFDDGLANNKSVAVPLLEKYGFDGWFCIPPGFTRENQDLKGREDKLINLDYGVLLEAQEGKTMNDGDLKVLSKNHHIISHTYSHMRLPSSECSQVVLKRELKDSKKLLSDIIGYEVKGFCWVGGEYENYSEEAQMVIKEKYDFSFQTNNYPITKDTDAYFINRNNVEVWYSRSLFLLTLSGFYDLIYWKKRKMIKEKLNL